MEIFDYFLKEISEEHNISVCSAIMQVTTQ